MLVADLMMQHVAVVRPPAHRFSSRINSLRPARPLLPRGVSSSVYVDYLSIEYLFWAIARGGISAASLPLGSALGLQAKPRPTYIAALAAFGAGALIAALSVELVAPTLFALEESMGASQQGDPYTNFYALVTGAVLGGVAFVLLDQLVNSHGGFLRRTTSTIAHFTARKHKRQMELLQELSRFPLLKDLSPEQINSLVTMVRPVEFNAGVVMANQGDAGTELVFVIKGAVDAISDSGLRAEFQPGNVVGMVPLIMGVPHPGTLTVREDVSGISLSKVDFDRLRSLSPEFDNAARELTTQRLEYIGKLIATRDQKSTQWLRQAGNALKTGAEIPDTLELRKAREEHRGAPLAIWLGILIDGLPESFVIGAGLLVLLQAKAELLGSINFSDVVPYTLIAGLFLSNFPEALASSANMRLQGWGKRRIFLLWFSLMGITGVGAGAGFALADSLSHAWLIFAEGLAAGAMLTMIAAAMIPEAVHMGSANLVGLSTLAGFLAAISFKLLE
jgi:zinc transporter ZupT